MNSNIDGLLFKVLKEDRMPHNGGSGQWPRVGSWLELPANQELVPCRIGLHLCRKQDLVKWLGPVIYIAQYSGEEYMIHHDTKVVVRRARLKKQIKSWNSKNRRLFACDVAEHALQTYSKNPDQRSWNAIEVARQFVNNKATEQELLKAGNAAAATYAAAYADAYAAAAAAYAAAAESERSWQTNLLFDKYLIF